MSIILPNLNHLFTSLVPVPVPVPVLDFRVFHTPQHMCLGEVAQRYGSFLGRGKNQDVRYMK